MVNADVRARLRVADDALAWAPSPQAGVDWKILEHDGRAPGRLTALMRWRAGATLELDAREMSEEILILDGACADELGEYVRGTYLRTPPGALHALDTETGCTALVKLIEPGVGDRERVAVDTRHALWMASVRAGVEVMPLHRHGVESASLLRMAPRTRYYGHRHVGGEEIFVISGAFEDELGFHPQGTWLRYPPMSAHEPTSARGCVLHVKAGHLALSQRPRWPLRRTI